MRELSRETIKTRATWVFLAVLVVFAVSGRCSAQELVGPQCAFSSRGDLLPTPSVCRIVIPGLVPEVPDTFLVRTFLPQEGTRADAKNLAAAGFEVDVPPPPPPAPKRRSKKWLWLLLVLL